MGSSYKSIVSDEALNRDKGWVESLWKPIQVGQHELKVIDRGSGEALIFVPVFFGTEYIYTQQFKELSKSFRSILYRRRESLEAPITLEDRVTELYELLSMLDIEQVHLCGHSEAAMVAMAFAAKFPEKVKSLVVSCVPDVHEMAPARITKKFYQWFEKWPLERFIPESALRSQFARSVGSIEGITAQQINEELVGIPQFKKLFKFSLLPLLLDYNGKKIAANITCPVLLMHHNGQDHAVKLSQVNRLATHFPNLRSYTVLEDGGHMFIYARAEQVTSSIKSFYQEIQQESKMPPLVVKLTDVTALQVELVGRKAGHLAHMLRLNMDVPTGFCITTVSLMNEVKRIGLDTSIHGEVSVEWSEALQEQIMNSRLAADFLNQILLEYNFLLKARSNVRVAVRSSSTKEDLAESSFAGQYETILNVANELQLIDAVKKCLASYWSYRAVVYRQHVGLEDGHIHMGILIQEMVNPVSSGILFTMDPRGQGESEKSMLVNAVWGLGEAGVSGTVTPDEYTIGYLYGRVLQASIADKKFMLQSKETGGVEEIALTEAQSKQNVLTAGHLQMLAKLGRNLEAIYGRPQDIEWALDNNRLVLLQVRPITTLHRRWEMNSRINGHWLRWSALLEWGEVPISPMTQSVLIEYTHFDQSFQSIGLYLPSVTLKTIKGFLYSPSGVKWTWRWFLTPLKLFKAYVSLHQQFQPLINSYLGKVGPWLNCNLQTTSSKQLLLGVDVMSKATGEAFGSIIARYYGVCVVSELIFSRVYRWATGDRERAGYLKLLHGFENKSLETDRRFWELAQEVKKYPSIMDVVMKEGSTIDEIKQVEDGAAFAELLEQMLHEVGHRLQDLDITCKTAKDDPTISIGVLRLLLLAETPNPAKEMLERAKKREQRLLEVRNRIKNRPIRSYFFEKTYKLAAFYNTIRENRPFYLGQSWQRLRETLVEIGNRLVAEGRLDTAERIFFLRRSEVELSLDGANFSKLAVARYKEWEWQKKNKPADEFNPPRLRKWLASRSRNQDIGDAILSGTPGSPGIITGRVRIVKDMNDFPTVHPGDVVVAPSTTPAWTVLFGIASAIVTDVGGSLSHAAIVAREYGIPAVLGTGKGTQVLEEGQLVRIDGTSGRVFLVREELAS